MAEQDSQSAFNNLASWMLYLLILNEISNMHVYIIDSNS